MSKCSKHPTNSPPQPQPYPYTFNDYDDANFLPEWILLFMIRLRNTLYYTIMFFVLTDMVMIIRRLLLCWFKETTALFLSLWILAFGFLFGSSMGEEVEKNAVFAVYFACALMLLGIAIWAALSLCEFISNSCWIETLRTFAIGFCIIFVTSCLMDKDESGCEVGWMPPDGPIPLFKDLK